MGVSNGGIMNCFHHKMNRHGKPLTFSPSAIKKMNTAIEKIAEDTKKCVLVFGSSQTFTNSRGNTYDPALIEAIREGIGKFLNCVV